MQSGFSVKDFPAQFETMISGARIGVIACDQPQPSSRPIPSRQSRNASKRTLGVQDNIMPKNTACKVVTGFRSPRRYFCGISALDHRRLPAEPPAPHNAALLLLHIAAHTSLEVRLTLASCTQNLISICFRPFTRMRTYSEP